MKQLINYLLLLMLIAISSCDKNDKFVVFSIENDVTLGKQLYDEISTSPDFNILAEGQYPRAYNFINTLKSQILESDDIAYRDEFLWEIKIIENDTILNAFATPGGYIYLYTGLLKYLDSEDALAGVIAHEIAHADLRHTTRNLQKAYGLNILLSIIFGENTNQLEAIAGQLAGTLAGLSFSRDYEREADDQSVLYLADTPYSCAGAALFFEKLKNESEEIAGIPEFLSTHPSPDNRIEDIKMMASEINCDLSTASNTAYTAFQESLP